MKLAIVSDIHLEFYPADERHDRMKQIFDGDYTDCIAVFAGDILTQYKAPEFLSQYRDWFRDIIFIPGNHDLWGANISDIGSHELDRANETFEIDGKTIACVVGWPYHFGSCETPIYEMLWERGLHERRKIGDMTWGFWCNQARRDFEFIEQVKPDIVISHYPPSIECNNPQFEGSEMNPLFVSSLDEWLAFADVDTPSTWVSGHTHWSWDTVVGNTRLIGNCHGYKDYEADIDYHPLIVRL